MISEISILMIETPRINRMTSIDRKYLKGLIKDIKEQGLIQPIYVRPIERGKYSCIDGAFRLMAYKKLKRPTIPCRIVK